MKKTAFLVIFLVVIFAAANICTGQIQSDRINKLSKIIELNPKDADAYRGRGYAYYLLREYPKAIEDYTKAIELNPKDADAYLGRGGAYFYLGEYRKVIDDCTKAIALDPKDANAYFGRGGAYFYLGEYRKAIDDYTKVIESKPEESDVYKHRSDAYRSRGLAYETLNFPTKACDDFYNAGLLYLKTREKAEALKCVDLMKDADPRSPLIKKLMNKIYSRDK